MAELVVTLTGDEANLFRAQQKILKQEMEMAEGYVKAGKAGKKSADDIADAHVKAFQQSEAAAKKLDQAYQEQIKSLELQSVAIKKGKAAAIEMKAVQDGLTHAQAKRLGDLQRENDLAMKNKKSVEDQSSLTDGLTSKAASWAAGLVTVSAGAAAITEHLREHNRLAEESLRLTLDSAKAQSGASQNLTGLTSAEKAKALASATTIQENTGFSDKNEILNAVGASYGITGSLEKTQGAIEAAIPLAIHSPENLKELTRSSLSVQRMTGVDSIEDSLGFLQNAAGVAFVDNNAAVAKNLTPLLATAVAGAPTQDAKQASSQAAAIFGKITQDKQDPLGDTSRVAADKFLRTIASVSTTLGDELTKLDTELAPLKDKQRITDVEKAQMVRADITIDEKQKIVDRMGGSNDSKAIDARADLEEAKANKVKLLENVSLDELETKKLAKLQKQRDELATVKDTGTIFGRMEQAQNNESLRELVLEKLGNDESRTVFEGLLKKDNQAGLAAAANTVQFDRAAYDQQVTEEKSLTPQLGIATLDSKQKGIDQSQSESIDLSTESLVRKTVSSALENNKLTGFKGVGEGMLNAATGWTGADVLSFRDPDQAPDLGIMRLKGQRDELLEGGLIYGPSNSDLRKADRLEKSIELLEELKALRATFEKQNVSVDEQTRLLKQLADKGQERGVLPQNAPNPAPAIRAQINQPVVTGAN
jgi:hypothetical protein